VIPPRDLTLKKDKEKPENYRLLWQKMKPEVLKRGEDLQGVYMPPHWRLGAELRQQQAAADWYVMAIVKRGQQQTPTTHAAQWADIDPPASVNSALRCGRWATPSERCLSVERPGRSAVSPDVGAKGRIRPSSEGSPGGHAQCPTRPSHWPVPPRIASN
jgi:hypothetical protein